MISNGYLDTNIQKAFLPGTPGVIEQQAKLAAIISTAKRSKRSLAIAWIDIANAYGSVHHSLIQFALERYHAPKQFCSLFESWYSSLSAKVLTADWESSFIPLNIGVYQGDPFSVVAFITVMNTLAESLKSEKALGFSLPNFHHSINQLLYADDTCIIGHSPAACQHLLERVNKWLQWSRLRAKVSKCYSLGIQGSLGKVTDPNLTLAGERIPALNSSHQFKFLGVPMKI